MVALVFSAISAPLLRAAATESFDAYDERTFHLPTIQAFMADWPAFDLRHMQATTGPLYHAVLATVGVCLGLDVIGLRVVNLLVSLLCLWVIHAQLARRPSVENALVVTLAVALSPYFLGSSVRLMTDDMALLFVVAALAAMELRSCSVRDLVAVNGWILLAVMTRQSYAWLVGAYLWFAGSCVRPLEPGSPMLGRVSRVLLPLALPMIGLALLVLMWGGTTPPGFRDTPAFSPDAPIFVVSLLGTYGCFLILALAEMWREARVPAAALAAAAAGAVLVLLLHPVSNAYPVVHESWTLRGGWLWLAAAKTPNVLGTAALFWLLFPLGTVFGAILFGYARVKQETLWAPSLLLFTVASALMPWTYQKYYEPLLLVFVGQLLGHGDGWRYRLGPVLLLGAFGVMTYARYYS